MRSVLAILSLVATTALHAAVLSNGSPALREAAVAVSPTDPRVVLAAAIGSGSSSSDFDVRIFRSKDAGQTWTALGVLPKQLGGVALQGHWDPVLAFDRTGRAYLVVVAAVDNTRWRIGVYRSTDQGTTWTGTDASAPAVGRNDKPWIAIDNDGAIHAAWYQLASGASGLAYSVSRDGGATFSAPRLFTSFGWPFVAVNATGTVYLGHTPTFGTFEVIRSTDGGVTFDAPVRVATEVGQDPQHLAARGTYVFATIAAADGIYFTRSSDSGATWTPRVRVSGEGGGMMGSVSVDRVTGDVVVTWLEKETSTRSRLATIRSSDNGATFTSTRSLGDAINATRPIGEYNQLATQSGIHIAVYADEKGALFSARLDANGTPQPPPAKRRSVR